MTLLRFLLTAAAVAWLANVLPRYFDGSWLGWLVTVPGTFIHELAHYGFALLLGGNPGTFSIIPSFSGGQMMSYGHITFSPSWWNAATVALAPVLVAPASVWLMAFGTRLSLPLNALCVWAAAAGFYSAMPSSADFAIALTYPGSWLPAIFILCVSLWIWWRMILSELSRNLRM